MYVAFNLILFCSLFFLFNVLVLIVCLDFMGLTFNGNKDIRKKMVERRVVVDGNIVLSSIVFGVFILVCEPLFVYFLCIFCL